MTVTTILKILWWIYLTNVVIACFIAWILGIVKYRKIKKQITIGMRVHLKDGSIENLTPTIFRSLAIGRSDLSDLYFEDENLSRRHFEISYKRGKLYIRDLNTTNGTYVNGMKLQTTRRLRSGDQINAGSTRFIVGW